MGFHIGGEGKDSALNTRKSGKLTRELGMGVSGWTVTKRDVGLGGVLA